MRRALKFKDFSLEHIIPQQALRDDPAGAKAAVSRNERSSITLLCRKTLVFEKKSIPGHGCNSWKGSHFDRFIREALRSNILRRQFNSRHHVSLLAAVYLGLFREYGYQIALTPAGLLMRSQFFQPNSPLKNLPITSQMVLFGEAPEKYAEEARDYLWRPFKITIEDDGATIVTRHFSIRLPLSRNPNLPAARVLPYAPKQYKFRPDLTTVFD